jgi:catechol 2,3-dioxygenase-like lactoylglutathione lyase family enzyme
VTALFHVGVAVSDLTKSIRVFEDGFGFKLASLRSVDHEYIGSLIGALGVSAEIAMLEIGDGTFLELISWKKSDESTSRVAEFDLSTTGTHHICIYVEDASAIFSKLTNLSEVSLVNEAPMIIPIGPNTGCKVFFALVLDEVYVEVFEKVTR